jgi:hypothetical protein
MFDARKPAQPQAIRFAPGGSQIWLRCPRSRVDDCSGP